MALSLSFARETPNQVLFSGNSCVKEVILNRPMKLNILNHEMICKIARNLTLYENDPSVKLVLLKANGKAFCAGGDVTSVIASALIGHWTYSVSYYRKQLALDYFIATYKKPVVCLINGIVMGGGAGISMNTTFKVVTEKTVFGMPEASIGHYPDVGEYVGLTGAQLNGVEMVACGLATHFVPSKGARAKLFEKDNKPKWEPSKLEMVSKEMVDQYFSKFDDQDWESLQLPITSNTQSKL
ncbi:putative 3-hydroxyisobutyryl-CoA hydrolase 3 [Senna tora]|uniref:3-hydroxyisobutyryl-CoA hydrolase n=1 Tax=Senna tora TaxID=362788 RepID=A0A834SZ67_9FABA|nr:putative 3-hydroxyisobutyryl-CoA hydrolase 3 [Senna tora]